MPEMLSIAVSLLLVPLLIFNFLFVYLFNFPYYILLLLNAIWWCISNESEIDFAFDYNADNIDTDKCDDHCNKILKPSHYL